MEKEAVKESFFDFISDLFINSTAILLPLFISLVFVFKSVTNNEVGIYVTAIYFGSRLSGFCLKDISPVHR